MSVRDHIDWLAESTVPENQMDEVGVMLDSIGGDVSSFFSSGSKKNPIVIVGDEERDADSDDHVSMQKTQDEGHGEFNTPSPEKAKTTPKSVKRKPNQDSDLKTKRPKGTSASSGRKKLGFADQDKQESKRGTKEKKKKKKTSQNQD
jgi:hypothetical protein